MKEQNIDVLSQDYYRLILTDADSLKFKYALSLQDVDYYTNEDSRLLNNPTEFYLLKKDRLRVESIVLENEIICNYSDQPEFNYRLNSKVIKLVFIVGLVAALISFLIFSMP